MKNELTSELANGLTGAPTSAPTSDALSGPLERDGHWWLVLSGLVALCVSVGPMVQFSFAVFLKPLSEGFGVDRATISAAPSLALLLAALATPVLGLLADRFGPRVIVAAAVPVSAAVFFLLGVAPSTGAFIALYALAGITVTGHSPLPFVKAIAASFTRRRGLALGIALAGIGIGNAVMPMLAQHLITVYGWQQAYAGLALCILVLAWPAALMLPGRQAGKAASVAMRYGVDPRTAVRSRMFWMLAAGFALVSFAASGAIGHIVALLSDRGIAADRAAAALGIGGVALIFGRLLSGYLIDRVFAPYVAAFFFATPLVGVLLLMTTSEPAWAWAAAALLGLGVGAEIDLIGYIVSRYLGQRSFGALYGYLYTAFMVGNALGPMAMGVSFVRTGSYTAALGVFAVGLVVACLFVLRLGPYRFTVSGEPVGE